MGIFLGVIAGLFLSAGRAYLIAVNVLCKSNDFGADEVDLQQYAGYDPISCENVGQERCSSSFFS